MMTLRVATTAGQGGAVSQFVERADENQIEVLPQIATLNRVIGDADHKNERTQQRNVAAERRQFFAYAQRVVSLRGEKEESDSHENQRFARSLIQVMWSRLNDTAPPGQSPGDRRAVMIRNRIRCR